MADSTEQKTPEERKKVIRTWTLMLCLLAAFGLALRIVTLTTDPARRTADLKLSIGYVLLILIFFIGFVILVDLASGRIDLSQLIEEKGATGSGDSGGASMGRFQLLIFTFVIGLSFFYVVICDCKIPDLPNSVLALLGVSATTYGVGKGIQATKDASAKNGNGGSTLPLPIPPLPAPPAPAGGAAAPPPDVAHGQLGN